MLLHMDVILASKDLKKMDKVVQKLKHEFKTWISYFEKSCQKRKTGDFKLTQEEYVNDLL